ncbi:MAG: Flp pilus assembly protein CpaB [Bdellovibrionales bacterium]|nr:Flp pilus assembly protein CpaB [Bdellovibrionales bacterium]
MNSRALLISLIASVMAVFFIQSYVSSIEEENSKQFGSQLLVMVAKEDIKEMQTLTDKSLEYKVIPKKFLEPAAVSVDPRESDEQSRKKDLRKFSGVIAVVPIKKGEQITVNKISEPSVRTGLSPQIAPGRRAITIGINDLTGLSKLVKPGDRVDVVAVIDTGQGKFGKFARTLLQDVIVLAAGKNVTNNPARTVETDPITGKEKVRALSEDMTFNTVTVEVDANQAQSLALIQSFPDNMLFLSLRNNDDNDRTNLPNIMLREFLPPEMAGQGGDGGMNGRSPAGR